MKNTMDKNQIAKFAEETSPLLYGILLPYPTADKIIAEVLENGEKSREKVMHMLMEFAVMSFHSRDEVLKKLSEKTKPSLPEA